MAHASDIFFCTHHPRVNCYSLAIDTVVSTTGVAWGGHLG